MILIAGMPGAGKSVAIEEFRKVGIPIVEMGEVIREETKKRGLDPNPKNTGNIAKKLREEKGKDAIAKLCLNKIRNIDEDKIVIDGVRSLKEVQRFQKELEENIKIISIHSSPKTRFKRLKKRGRSDDPDRWKEFKQRDIRELNFGLGKVIALSDKVIVNEGSEKEFKEKIKEIIKKI